jgi:hypothetical protein
MREWGKFYTSRARVGNTKRPFNAPFNGPPLEPTSLLKEARMREWGTFCTSRARVGNTKRPFSAPFNAPFNGPPPLELTSLLKEARMREWGTFYTSRARVGNTKRPFSAPFNAPGTYLSPARKGLVNGTSRRFRIRFPMLSKEFAMAASGPMTLP